nr:MAG TPA: hypothetical protein [Caudoviricetes sp.]
MNIAEILKYCPKGTKLYNTVYGEVEFVFVDERDLITIKPKNKPLVDLYPDGRTSPEGECILFPSKDQRDWSKFRLPVKRGDIMMTTDKRAFITNGEINIDGYPCACCGINLTNKFTISTNINGWTSLAYIPASEEAKKELFDKMKEAGYRWNVNTLELEKIEPEFKFKEGEILINEEGWLYLLVNKITNWTGKAAVLYPDGDFIAEATFALTPKGLALAKSSDRNKLFSFLVRKGYKYDKEQHKLVKQQFKPFDKVLVRDNNTDSWKADIYLGYDESNPFPYICTRTRYSIIIPYKGNEYLLGTINYPE